MTALALMRHLASRGGTLRVDRRGAIEVSGPVSLLFDPALLAEVVRKRRELAAELRAARGASR